MAEEDGAGGAKVQLPAVGKVPRTWLYVGGAAVAVVVAYAYWKRHQAAADPELVVDPATGATGETGYRNPAPQSGTTVPAPGGDPNAITTREQWTAAVVATLSNLAVDAQFVSLAISKYLDGRALTADEAAIIRQGWAFHGKPPGGPNTFVLVSPNAGTRPPPSSPGTPPETPRPPATTIPPPPAPAPPAPARRTYTVVSGDTLYGISRKMYGTDARWHDIYNANVGTIEATAKWHGRANSDNGHWIYPPTVLTIP